MSGPCIECGEWVSTNARAVAEIHFGCLQDRTRREERPSCEAGDGAPRRLAERGRGTGAANEGVTGRRDGQPR